jgi:glycerophosphoryl diester phosphodiesterase
MTETGWLTARPIAHRGLHNASQGIAENSLSAFKSAIENGYAIECDLQLTQDKKIIVFHDETTVRLTNKNLNISESKYQDLEKLKLQNSSDTILQLEDMLRHIDGRVPVFLEMKSQWNKSPEFAEILSKNIAAYDGHLAIMSFDPTLVHTIKKLNPGRPCGLVADRFSKKHWPQLNWLQRFTSRHLLYGLTLKPDFIAYDVNALHYLAPLIARKVFKRTMLTWTVRTREQQKTAAIFADQAIFEDFELKMT